jgi:RNA polymerase sigma-32 factor
VKRSKRLSREEEIALFKAGKAGEVVVANIPLVESFARRYAKGRPIFDDLVQQGSLGLLIAAKKWDPDRGIGFGTYATHWIRCTMIEWLKSTRRIVATPKSSAAHRVSAAMATRDVGSPDDLKHEASPGVALGLFELLSFRDQSDLRYGDDGSSYEWLTSEGDPEALLADAQAVAERATTVQKAIATLTATEQTIVFARLLTDDPCTGRELGERLGVSRQRVDQIEQRAIRKIAAALKSKVTILRPKRRATDTLVVAGEDHPSRKLSSDVVRAMRVAHRERQKTTKELSVEYGVSVQAAWEAITRRTWAHVA